MNQSISRYATGPGANVSAAFKASEYTGWIRNDYRTDYFDNLALQQTIYQAVLQTLGTVTPSLSQKITWNYNVIPNVPGNYQAFNAPQDITWDNNGNLVVNNYSMLVPNRSSYLSNTYPNTSDAAPAAGLLATTPVKQGKFYLEVEILEDTNYYFMLAPVAWESENLSTTGVGSIAAIGAENTQRSTGRGYFAGRKYNDSNLLNAEHSAVFPTKVGGTNKYNEPFTAGDILQFAYDTDLGVAFVGMNGIYARWNVSSSYTTMDGTNANTGIMISGGNPSDQDIFALYAVPFKKNSISSFMTDEQANCNVRVLTGNSCYYSPPVGYTDH
jgi:hypothetical protein